MFHHCPIDEDGRYWAIPDSLTVVHTGHEANFRIPSDRMLGVRRDRDRPLGLHAPNGPDVNLRRYNPDPRNPDPTSPRGFTCVTRDQHINVFESLQRAGLVPAPRHSDLKGDTNYIPTDAILGGAVDRRAIAGLVATTIFPILRAYDRSIHEIVSQYVPSFTTRGVPYKLSLKVLPIAFDLVVPRIQGPPYWPVVAGLAAGFGPVEAVPIEIGPREPPDYYARVVLRLADLTVYLKDAVSSPDYLLVRLEFTVRNFRDQRGTRRYRGQLTTLLNEARSGFKSVEFDSAAEFGAMWQAARDFLFDEYVLPRRWVR
jgi:hypothetical protein